MASYVYGNTTGTSNSKFRVVCEYTGTDQGNGYYQYRYRYYIQVTAGNFYGTNITKSWGGTTSVSGTGKYGHSGYATKNVAYGSNFTLGSTVYAQYTASQTYRSEISGSKVIATVPRPTYAVKYNANGGSGAPSSQTKTYGVTLKLSTTKPTRTGYTFKGWATSSTGSVAYGAGANYTANAAVTMYAVWQAITYTVNFDANGGSGAPAAQTKTYGVNLTLSSTIPTRANYNFLGWGVGAGATTITYEAGGTYTANAAITLYAVWELAYTAPRIIDYSVDRCNTEGELTDEGTCAYVKFVWETDEPVTEIQISWARLIGDGTSGSLTISATGTSGSVERIIASGTIDTEYQWTCTASVTDAKDTSSLTLPIPDMFYTIDLLKGGKGIAFGKPARNEGFEIAMKSLFEGDIRLKNGIWLSAALASGDFAEIIRMNEADQVELDWTSGGLKGRVMKELWTGTFSSGNLTIFDLPYYNVFAVDIADAVADTTANRRVILMRSVSNALTGVTGSNTGSDYRFYIVQLVANGTSLQFNYGVTMIIVSANGNISNVDPTRKIFGVYGIL